MKKLLSLTLCIIGLQCIAAEPIYIIFTSDNDSKTSASVEHFDYSDRWDKEVLRYPMRIFHLYNKDAHIARTFGYVIYNDCNYDLQIERKPASFLETVECIDLDRELPTLDKNGLLALLERFDSAERLYFIDRNRSTEETIELVPVAAASF